MIDGPLPGEKPVLHVYDLKERKDVNVVEGLSAYVLSADGKKVLYKLDRDYVIADVAQGKGEDNEDSKKKLDLSHMRVRLSPRESGRRCSTPRGVSRGIYFSVPR